MAGTTNTGNYLINFLNPIHENLLKASKTPIIGVIPSALQASISLVQIVVGAFFALTAGVLYLATKNELLGSIGFESATHALIGTIAVTNAVLNIFSLTYFNNHADQGKLFYLC